MAKVLNDIKPILIAEDDDYGFNQSIEFSLDSAKSMNATRVLLVEDDLADQMSFKRFVKKNALHYDYAIAGSLADAITLLESNSYDIILADHSLGDGTAFDLFAHITSTPLIFITGNGTEQTAVKALKAGAADYLSKDIDANYLQLIPITIENVLKAQAIKAELTRYQVGLEALVEQRTQELETEIERRKKIETQLRLLAITFETHETIVITDAKAKIIKVNKAFSKLTGYSATEVIGKRMSILKSGRQSPDFYKDMWKKLITTGEYEGELWNRSKSGRIYPEYLTITAVKDDAGIVSNYVGILTDITLQSAMLNLSPRKFNMKLIKCIIWIRLNTTVHAVWASPCSQVQI